ncbi:helicase [Bifidobacterium simiarum]|uniref:helicase n=1 Tax=Bifidobacterium simiarum TaxID=2045441 RepID=UPI001BDC16C8|nr:helicase [Bifidobacterium simiarum]MBT1166726.1 helicase [Bifidobacterium simiarum]
MAENADNADQNQQQHDQTPHGNDQPQSTDWEAKYREAVSHSREWEKRAKDNKAAADELQQLKESRMSEAQKAEARTARLQKELDRLRAEKQANAWRTQVAEETGLPAGLIVGDSLEAMQAFAKTVKEYVESRLPKSGIPAPTDGTVLPEDPRSKGADDLRHAFERINF